MNAVVDNRGMVTPTSAAVLRGSSAVNEVRDLLDQLSKVDVIYDGLVKHDENAPLPEPQRMASNIDITMDEVIEVIARRRQVITNKLENKGIRIAPEPDLSPSIGDEA